MRSLVFAGCSAALFTPLSVLAETYQVGPDKPYATIQDVVDLLGPGDVVEVDGDQTYPGDVWFRAEQSGTPDAPVTVRGIRVNGNRPVLEGVGTEQYHDMVVFLNASHFVFEGFEIVGDGDPDHSGLVHKADGVVLRDLLVHGVGGQGLLGTDFESGSLTLEASEFHSNGFELYNHQIYVATDESMYPGSVFRMQFCYVHDGAGGNNVKSRAERNEIYFNWIENAVYHELDLIGPDGQDEDLAREDSDVVGNVLVKGSEWRIARIGGDGTGNTKGRYRFVANTMILGDASATVIGMQETVESLELHDNVIYRASMDGTLVRHDEASGPEPEIVGSNNWISSTFASVPAELTGSVVGADPGFLDLASLDLRPAEGSPLVDAGTSATVIASLAIPAPLDLPLNVPPARLLGTHGARPADAALDIGAFELGSGAPPGEGTVTSSSSSVGPGTGSSSGGADGSGGSGGADAADGAGDGCDCAVGAPAGSPRKAGAAALVLIGLALGARRRVARHTIRRRNARRTS